VALILKIRSYITILALALLCCLPAAAQKKVSADIEVKQAYKGKVTTITKSVYCESNGRLVVVFHKPNNYFMLTNRIGETQVYTPSTNEVVVDNSGAMTSANEMLFAFIEGHASDLNLPADGYNLSSTTRDGEYIVKKFKSMTDAEVPEVEVAFKDYLPVYCAFLNNAGQPVRKLYYAHYEQKSRFTAPTRVTEITYGKQKDSTVTRLVYSNVKVDVDAPEFNFVVPSDAKVIDAAALAEQASKAAAAKAKK